MRLRSLERVRIMSVREAGLSIGTLALLTILGGCGSGASVAPSANGTASLAGVLPDNNGHGGHGKKGCSSGSGGSKTSGVIYTGQLYGHDVKTYQRSGTSGLTLKQNCMLMGGDIVDPQGADATVNGFVFFANGGGENVLVYRTKHDLPVGPIAILSDYGELPVNVGTNPNRNLVAVSNLETTSSGSGSVSVYLHRQTTASRTLTYGSATIYGAGIALDHQGNCFWGFNTNGSGSGTIVEFAKCNGSGKAIVSGIPNVGGIAFDQKGNMYYVNAVTSGSTELGIYQCAKTTSCQIITKGDNIYEPFDMNFDYHGKILWLSDLAGYIDAIDPSTGTILGQYSTGSSDPPFGIAPEPGG